MKGAVHQFVPSLRAHDAIGANVRATQKLLRELGFRSDIYTDACDEASAALRRPFRSYQAAADDRLIYHHCQNNGLAEFFMRQPGRKAVLYHNITPAWFFMPDEPATAADVEQGRAQLVRLARRCELGIGVSDFNSAELQAAGFARVHTLPLVWDDANLTATPDKATLTRLLDGSTNVLFVGRIAPNKRQDDCVRTLAAMAGTSPRVRLVLAGSGDESSSCMIQLRQLIRATGLESRVWVTGGVSPEVLNALYRGSHVYLSMSEHEGFGVPLVEAMRLDVPVLAYDAGAVRETLGGAGVLFRQKDFTRVAALASMLSHDPLVRGPLLEGQRERAAYFDASHGRKRLESALAPLFEPAPSRRAVSSPGKPTVGIVVQRYGQEVNGGAELHARLLAERLAKHAHVEVFTTTAKDYQTWPNEFEAGESELNGVSVRRFPVDLPRDLDAFTRYGSEIFSRPRTRHEEARWIELQGPRSSALLTALEAAEHVDFFVFFTYLYHPTVEGLPRVADRSVLVPTLHDEPALALRSFDRLLAAPRALVCNTPEEVELAHRRFRKLPEEIRVGGLGIVPVKASREAFRKRRKLGRYLLYAGRVDRAKGCEALFQAYEQYRARCEAPFELVLVGGVDMPVPALKGLHALGFVSDLERDEAIAGAEALIIPSRNESLSLVLLEALSAGVPVIANAESEVLAGHLERSGAGLPFRGTAELTVALLVAHEQERMQRLGAKGPDYVARTYAWDRVEALYLDLLTRYGKRGEARRVHAANG